MKYASHTAAVENSPYGFSHRSCANKRQTFVRRRWEVGFCRRTVVPGTSWAFVSDDRGTIQRRRRPHLTSRWRHRTPDSRHWYRSEHQTTEPTNPGQLQWTKTWKCHREKSTAWKYPPGLSCSGYEAAIAGLFLVVKFDIVYKTEQQSKS